MKQQELKIEYRAVEDLIPYARNARMHDEKQVGQIAGSIREFGFNNPVLIDGDNGIIAGHGRVLAAQKLGLDTVPCVELSHLSEVQKKAYILADNRLAENSTWDTDMLNLELEELKIEGFDIEGLGFENVEPVDFSHIEDLLNEGFGKEAGYTTETDIFSITFNFPSDTKETVDEYVKRVGKDRISEMIIADASRGC